MGHKWERKSEAQKAAASTRRDESNLHQRAPDFPMLEVQHVRKRFADTIALDDVSFEVARGEILCLLGPSGCGKTTLLRIVAGLEQADAGRILLDGKDLRATPVHQRDLGLMFQEFALFPHKDVYGNVAFGLRMAGLSRDEIDQRVREALELVGLGGFASREVHDLSGGEQQRVALARSLAPRPRLLMLDEPLGSLDRALRERLMNELRHILKSVGLTALYVTHDQSEAFALGDRVAIMQKGHIEQIGPPERVFLQPASPFVARFLGMTNLLSGRVTDSKARQVKTALGEFRAGPGTQPVPSAVQHAVAGTAAQGDQVMVLLRPEAAQLVNGTETAVNLVRGQVVERSFRGARYRLVVRHDSGADLAFELDVADGPTPSVGDEVTLSIRPEAINLLVSN
jgi:ABC-type Fe3+/spermidine/putrescine transport system ATPase subunit